MPSYGGYSTKLTDALALQSVAFLAIQIPALLLIQRVQLWRVLAITFILKGLLQYFGGVTFMMLTTTRRIRRL